MSTITKEFTKEQLIQKLKHRISVASGFPDSEKAKMDLELARIALASLEAEASGRNPVLAYADSYRDMANQGVESIPVWSVITDLERNIAPLFTAPPAPVSVPDEATPENIEILASTFAPRGVTYQWDRDECNAAADSWNACHAAMLQGADQPQIAQQNIPEIIPATQFKPVADLYGLTSPTGDETSFTFDAVEARDFIDGGWSCQEYVELERFQEAVSGNSPVIPDGWVACVDRMPSAGEQVLVYRPDAPESNDPLIKMATYVGGSAHGHGFDCYCKPTHWMPLPAAPQQEVK
ncbi:DUF551 domain-containing protein [Enterobacter hormaechei]